MKVRKDERSNRSVLQRVGGIMKINDIAAEIDSEIARLTQVRQLLASSVHVGPRDGAYTIAGVMPEAFWNFASAAWVEGPKYSVS